MRQSRLFTNTLRESPAGEVAKNAILLERAGFIEKVIAGVYSLLPLGLCVLKKIEDIIRDEMNSADGQEILMPALHPIENYKATKRDQIDVLFHLTSATGKELVLGQSHEEIVVPLVKKFIHSYKDLPIAVYQIQTKFRNELRPKSGIFRGLEFIMKDLYSFHASEDDFEQYYNRMKDVYKRVFERAGIGASTYLTYASGGSFSKYSHEFQTLTSAGEDLIHICRKCEVAVNKEIIKELSSCPKCGNNDLRQEKAVEVGNIFPLKTKFSDAFELSFVDADGVPRPIIMGCYGIGLTRLMGAIVELTSDERGMIWPESVAPYQVHLLILNPSTEVSAQKVKESANALYTKLGGEGIEVLYDDREDKTAGEKFADSDLVGIPWRVVVSEKTLKKKGIELKHRKEQKSDIVSEAILLEKIRGK